MGGGKSQQKVELKEVKEKQILARSQLLRGACVFLTEGAFRQRKAYFTSKVGHKAITLLLVGVGNVSTMHVCIVKRLQTVIYAGNWCVTSKVGAKVGVRADDDQPRPHVWDDEAEP